jgi:hypothetical protein
MVQHSGAARCNKAQPEMQQGWAAVGPHTVRSLSGTNQYCTVSAGGWCSFISGAPMLRWARVGSVELQLIG